MSGAGEAIAALASFSWGKTQFAVTGWARDGKWCAISGVHTFAVFAPEAGHAACAVIQAAREVGLFLTAPPDSVPPDGQPLTLQDFDAALARHKGSALQVLVAAMAAAERARFQQPEVSNGD